MRIFITKYKIRFLLLFLAIIIFSIFKISYSLCWQYYPSIEKSFVNWEIFSQMVAGFGTLLAVIVALFLDTIHKFFNKTSINIENNLKYDKNYFPEVYGSVPVINKLRFFLHLNISNEVKRVVIRNLKILLLPSSYEDYNLDIPRPFRIAGSDNEKNFEGFLYQSELRDSLLIDLAEIKMYFQNDSGYQLIFVFSVANHNNIIINLLENPKFSFIIKSDSPDLIDTYYFKVDFFIDLCKIFPLLNKMYHIYENISNDKKMHDSYFKCCSNNEIKKFYDYISISITKITNTNK